MTMSRNLSPERGETLIQEKRDEIDRLYYDIRRATAQKSSMLARYDAMIGDMNDQLRKLQNDILDIEDQIYGRRRENRIYHAEDVIPQHEIQEILNDPTVSF